MTRESDLRRARSRRRDSPPVDVKQAPALLMPPRHSNTIELTIIYFEIFIPYLSVRGYYRERMINAPREKSIILSVPVHVCIHAHDAFSHLPPSHTHACTFTNRFSPPPLSLSLLRVGWHTLAVSSQERTYVMFRHKSIGGRWTIGDGYAYS